MKGIINFSLNNNFAVWIMTIIITVSGLYAGLTMKQETLPDLELPIVQVTTIYPGAAPEEVVDKLTQPLEQRILNISGVQNVSSQSMENVSAITVQFDYGTNMDKAEQSISNEIKDIELPGGVNSPSISRLSINAFPILSLSVSSKDGSLEDLTKLVEDQYKPALEGLNGVASVAVAGQHIKEVQLRFNQEKMAELGLSEETVKGIVQASVLKVPLGMFEMGETAKTVVVDGNIVSLEELKAIAIPVIPAGAGAAQAPAAPNGGSAAGASQGAPQPQVQPGALQASQQGAAAAPGIPTVQLKEVADIELVALSDSISRTNGQESIGIQIVKGADANTVQVANLVKDKVEEFKKDNTSLEFVTMFDQAEPIEQSVHTMLNKALFGALFAILVILVFLRNIRMTLISVISIPLSLLIGILLLKQMDITLNMMTLGAMTVAIGRVVDDSIVVIENIYRRSALKNEPLKGKALILDATREMFIPIASSTIVTIAVFVPLAAVGGMVGELFIPFALTMVFALLASLLVAVTIVPMLGHTMFRNGLKGKQLHDDEAVGRLGNGYRRLLQWTLNHKVVTLLAAVIILVGSLFLTSVVGTSFLPEEEQKYAMVTYSPAPGELLEQVKDVSLQAEELFLQTEDVTDVQYSVGGSNPLNPAATKSALFYVMFEDDTANFIDRKKELISKLQDTTGGKGQWKEMDMSGGMGGSNLTLNVFGPSYDEIHTAIGQIESVMKEDGNLEDVESSVTESYEQYTLVANQEKLSSLGLTTGQIAMALSPEREQPVLTSVKVEGKEYEVKIYTDPKTYKSIADIENETIMSPLGMPVQIKDVVEVKEGESPNTITRLDGRMYASIEAAVTTADVGKASSQLQQKVEELELPEGVSVEFGGVTEQLNETFTQLGLAMLAAIAIVYLVLVVTFGGGLAPFAILFSLPFTVIGALVGLWIAGETISVSAMMGALMLIGIVVTNAIVLIDRVIKKEESGLSTRDALLEAAGTRLRPILMTALATIGALLPLAFGFESAGIISKGLGVTVIGGLTSSTLLTLLIVPIVYEILMKLKPKRQTNE
ncbi:efflux RND transporter permease subunit [Paenibacillus tarimensis]|uniref:efflux RND transporter permease subunit n=1 Tax=Paenibacillus tarimensis TaxID=416012 RepID=UPI001F34A554|nr:efflux RND transporter permease subunit [Paenibacillus tarimensis]MCF2942730.1 efflux RND transporter permease subunit [Paenibacillus tarimensis]